MTKEESFLAKLGDSIKKNELLRQPNDTKVKVTVGIIIAFCKDFHAKGYDDGGNELSYFDKIFGTKK